MRLIAVLLLAGLSAVVYDLWTGHIDTTDRVLLTLAAGVMFLSWVERRCL